VSFMATPGEKVTVTTPAQQEQEDRGVGSISVHMSVYASDANSFNRNQGQVLAQLSNGLRRAQSKLGVRR